MVEANGGEDRPGGHSKSQTHYFINHYLTAKDWGVVVDPNGDFVASIRCILKRARSIGLVWYDERTLVTMV